MAEVMEAGFRNADLRNDLLKMLQNRVVDQMAAFRVYENEVFLVFPCLSGSHLIFLLLCMYLLQDLHHGRRRLYDAGFAVLRRSEFIGAANVKHFFTCLGKQNLTRCDKQNFTWYGNEFLTWVGKQFFTSPGKQKFTWWVTGAAEPQG